MLEIYLLHVPISQLYCAYFSLFLKLLLIEVV